MAHQTDITDYQEYRAVSYSIAPEVMLGGRRYHVVDSSKDDIIDDWCEWCGEFRKAGNFYDLIPLERGVLGKPRKRRVCRACCATFNEDEYK